MQSLFASFTPALYPYSNLDITGVWIPPINPTLLFSVILPATSPVKYAASFSLNNIGVTFSGILSYVSSINTNCLSG